MGYYINPKVGSKEEWLKHHGEILLSVAEAAWLFESDDYLPVCLVDNGPFTAAGIAFCKEELDEFSRSDDRRRKAFFKVSKKDLFEVCPELQNYFEKMKK